MHIVCAIWSDRQEPWNYNTVRCTMQSRVVVSFPCTRAHLQVHHARPVPLRCFTPAVKGAAISTIILVRSDSSKSRGLDTGPLTSCRVYDNTQYDGPKTQIAAFHSKDNRVQQLLIVPPPLPILRTGHQPCIIQSL